MNILAGMSMNVPESAGQDIAATGRILTGGERFEGQQRVAISQNKQDSTMTSPEKRIEPK